MVTCTYCQAENEESALICANCKQPLESITLISRGLGGSRTKTDGKHRSHLGKLKEHEVAIYVGKSEQPMIVSITTKLTLGRHRELPDPDLLDFTPFDGYKLGMSRNHAALFFKDGALCIQDLGSANGTWVNSTRLQPYDVVALLSGSVISLAQVMVTIYY
ncbi:MAG: FHA domain-containing protein [Anaerolineae bacterium]|nr:FHA domain-containing protein [Anaerolineae bacterium]